MPRFWLFYRSKRTEVLDITFNNQGRVKSWIEKTKEVFQVDL